MECSYMIILILSIILFIILYKNIHSIKNISIFQKLNPHTVKEKIFEGFSKNISIVTSFFREDTRWLCDSHMQEFLKEAERYNIVVNLYIYIKSDKKLSNEYQIKKLFNDNVYITRLPNIGMCGHTFIYHICNSYYNDELLIFLPGSCTNNIKIELYKDIMKHGWRYDYYFTYVFHLLQKNFTIDEYQVTDPSNKTPDNLKFKLSEIRPFWKWYNSVTSPYKNLSLDDYYLTNIKDIFAMHTIIIRGLPLEFYLDILEQLSKSVNSEVCHYVERMWYPLFTSLVEEIK